MTDEEVEMWMILKFGTLEEAWKAMNVPVFEELPEIIEGFTVQEKEIVELYRIRKFIDAVNND